VQLENVRRIITEDYSKDDQEVVSKLAGVLNQFMDDVVELSRKNVGYDNLLRSKINFDCTVDASGVPIGNNLINLGLPSYSGKTVIDVLPLQNNADRVISAPYIECAYQGNGFVRVLRVLGLPPGKKMRVVVEFIA
jgi:hypothetical protein